MATTVFTPTQRHLLHLFEHNDSENFANEIKNVLYNHFQMQLDAEADMLWEEGTLNQERLDALRNEDFHSDKWKK